MGKAITPLNDKLKNVEWGEFRIGNLFKIEKTKSFNKDKLTYGSEYDYVTRTSENQGILQQTGFVNEKNINKAGNWSLGLLQMDFFYRNKPWYAGQFVRNITAIKEFPKTSLRFITTSLNKLKPILLEVLVRNVESKFLNEKIQLPIQNGEIDFDFMASFVAELENERILKLENYLNEIGLSDYFLTEQERQALEDLENEKIVFDDFAFKSIFNNIKQGKRLKKDDQISGNIPFIMAGISNTGVVNYISNPIASFPKNSITIDIFGNTFYRNYDYAAGDDTGVYWNDSIEYSKETMIFLTSAMRKSVMGKFDYGKKLRSSKSFDFKMKLPIKDNKPDYETMETVISAIHKMVMKDVVLYVERKKKELNKLTKNAHA